MMGLLARHPFATPDMPPGGSPAIDGRYLWWAREYCAYINACWADRWTDRWGNRPDEIGDLVNEWQLTNHLYKYCLGGALPLGRWPQWRFKIRLVAVQFHYRTQELRREAKSYVRRLAAEFRELHPDLELTR